MKCVVLRGCGERGGGIWTGIRPWELEKITIIEDTNEKAAAEGE